MTFWQNVLRVLDARMTEPQPYGAYHLIWFALSPLWRHLRFAGGTSAPDPKREFGKLLPLRLLP